MASLWRTIASAFGRAPREPRKPPEEDSLVTDFGSLRPVQRANPMSRVQSVTASSATYQSQPLDRPGPWIPPQTVVHTS